MACTTDINKKLAKIEALISGSSSPGERQAAEAARSRLLGRAGDEPKEFRLTVRSYWEKQILAWFKNSIKWVTQDIALPRVI